MYKIDFSSPSTTKATLEELTDMYLQQEITDKEIRTIVSVVNCVNSIEKNLIQEVKLEQLEAVNEELLEKLEGTRNE